MAQLTISEWSALCALVDVIGPKTKIAFGNGPASPFQEVAGMVIQKKFDVVKIKREAGKVFVWLDFGKGCMQWFELNERVQIYPAGLLPEQAA